MAQILGTNILNPIVPFDTNDINSTHIDVFGQGSFRTVQNLSEMYDIKEQRRKNLMLVAVESNSSNGTSGDMSGIELYQLHLNNPDNPLSDNDIMNNDNFVPLAIGSSTGSDWVFPAPASSNSNGTYGQRSFDDNFVYICIETNLWKRIAMDFFIYSGSGTSGLSGTNFDPILGSVPYWDGTDWNNTIVVKSVEDGGTNGIKVTYTNDMEAYIPIFGSGDDIWVLPPPISSFSPGIEGTRSYDDKYLYICVAENLWKRINLDYFLFSTSGTSGTSGYGIGEIAIGSVPVWNGGGWLSKITVSDVDAYYGTDGTSGFLISYTDETTKIIPFESGTSELGLPTDGGYGSGTSGQGQASGVNIGDSIEDAFDKVESLLEFLVPSKSPPLSDWSSVLSNDVSGKLSFDISNPIGGYIAADSTGIGIVSPVSSDGSWTIGSKRLGIHSKNSDTITGVLNDQVVVDPNNAYPADTFGTADKGDLNLYINNILVDTIDLSSSVNTIVSTNISVSAHIYSKFSNGNEFTKFVNRTGTWSLSLLNININNGYNYVVLEHDLGTGSIVLNRYEFIIDDNVLATSYSNESLHTLVMSGSNKLSGISYHTGGTAQYNIDIDNLYRNTYYSGSDAIVHSGNSNSYGILVTSPNQSLSNGTGDESKQTNILNKTVTFASSGRRIIDGSISLNTTAKRTVQSTVSTTLNTVANSIDSILLDNFVSAPSSTLLFEGFDDESKRLLSTPTYDLVTDITNNPWDSTQSLNDGSVGHTTGLQTIDGKLIYPGNVVTYPDDFRTSNITNGDVFNDGGIGGSGRDYSSLVGNRTYYRYFRQVSPSTANFTINITGSTGTFVSVGTALTGNNIRLEMKAPTETGWLDCYNDFSTGNFSDGNGSRSSGSGVGRAFNTNWGLTIGTKSTANTSGYIVIRITVGPSFVGNFTGITFTYN